jgi:hypothetical protein
MKWYDNILLRVQTKIPRYQERLFHNNFNIDHQFNGIRNNRIDEVFVIRPASVLGHQVLSDGIHTFNSDIHLKSDIHIDPDSLRLHLNVQNPEESKDLLGEVKQILLDHLLKFQKRFSQNPQIKYIEPFCKQCIYYETKPLNLCIRQCQYTPAKGQDDR